MNETQAAIDLARARLSYDETSGKFNWKVRPCHRMQQDSQAGYATPSGYIRIKLKSKGYSAHRLAWAMVYGDWPAVDVDHINGIKSDNRISNLRLATDAQNTQNTFRARSDNRSGALGVSLHRNGKWVAQIQVDGTKRYLGLHATPEEAHAAYLTAKRDLHPFSTLVAGP